MLKPVRALALEIGTLKEEKFQIKVNQGRLSSNYIMKIPIFREIPLIIGILLRCAQACNSSRPRGWYLKVRKADYEAKHKELKEAKRERKGVI